MNLEEQVSIVLGEPEEGLQMEGVAAVLQAAEVSERMWIEERPFMWWVGWGIGAAEAPSLSQGD